MLLFFTDDILRKNMYLSKHAKVQDKSLGGWYGGWYAPIPPIGGIHDGIPDEFPPDWGGSDIGALWLYRLSLVQEIRYERIKPTFDGNTLADAKDIHFHVPPNTDYFTR